jgi:hypothetical protein
VENIPIKMSDFSERILEFSNLLGGIKNVPKYNPITNVASSLNLIETM